MKSMGSEINLH